MNKYSYKRKLTPLEAESHYLESHGLATVHEALKMHTHCDVGLEYIPDRIYDPFKGKFIRHTIVEPMSMKDLSAVDTGYLLKTTGYDTEELKNSVKLKGGDSHELQLA